ncbi:hypothetical protein AN958_09578 [Leucoagaricus sp. SymC.cos]|nr:hypothetical protein AN958_09578 [Leucoagaricus sp. SymC.cos]
MKTLAVYPWLGLPITLIDFNILLTDGLLVWRCYILQSGLSSITTRRWHYLSWIIPTLIWLFMVGASRYLLISGGIHTLTAAHFPVRQNLITLSIALISCNAALNIFCTTTIILRLILHRRRILLLFKDTTQSRMTVTNAVRSTLSTSAIILESAAINIPAALIFLVGFVLGDMTYLAVVFRIADSSQSVASILLIYQVAKRRMFEDRGASNYTI